jgi:spore coat protein CotF
MNDKYLLNDVLETEKNMVVNMAIALNEASCDEIYDLYLKVFKDISKEAKVLFNIAYNNGWYKLDNAPQDKITEELNKFKKELGC